MSQLEEKASSIGVRALCREGRWLCSPRDPEKEAYEWVKRQKVHADDRVLMILGGGATHHVIQLLKTFPEVRIKVIELHEETLTFGQNYLRSQGYDKGQVEWLNLTEAEQIHCSEYDIVLNFRPAWAGLEGHYMALYFRLTQNSASSLARAAEENKMPLTSQILREKGLNVDFALKDLDFSSDSSDEVKFWKALRELVE